MKKLILLAFLFCGPHGFSAAPEISEIRNLYKQAAEYKSSCIKLIKLLDGHNEKNNPLFLGYLGCATMMMAKHVFNPFSKYAYFNKGENMLEKAIQSDADNIELRFLRLTIQKNAPSFLGYSINIEADKSFLQRSIPYIQDASLKDSIISYLTKLNKK